MEKIEIGVWKKPSNAREEAFRTLRTNIQFCGDDIKVIMISSFAPSEGKTNVVMSLAHSMAEAGKRVLLLDTDIRKSVMAGRYRIRSVEGKQLYGLSHYLSGQRRLDEVICVVKDNPKLDMILAGPSVPNPTEILDKHYFPELIEFAREYYDVVIVDTAPIGMVIDAAVVAKYCDGAILVIAQGDAKRRQLIEAKEQLAASGIRILGAVLNKVDISKSSYYGKYYGKYGAYGNYGNYEDLKASEEN
jgi:capsular exopolysaccharide synthesis family protein